MNKPIILAQSSVAQTPKRTVRVVAPANKTPEIVNIVPNVAIDLQAIARNQISLVKSGDNLVILFDDQRSIILSNFYGPTGAPLTGLDLILSPTTTIPAVDLSRILPVGASDTIVPASGTSNPSGSLILSDLFHLTSPVSSSTQTPSSSSSQSTSTSQTPAAGLTNFVTPFSTGRDALLPSFTNQIQINKAPVVNGLLGVGVQEDQPNLARFDLLGGASDPNGDTLSISGLTYSVDGRGTGSTLPAGLSLSGSRLTVNAASPAFNDLGVGEIRLIRIAYTISDGHGGSVAQTAVITVEGTNDAPVVGAPVTLPDASFEDRILTISAADLLTNVSDPDGDALTITAVNARSASGAAVSLVNGNIVYDPTHAPIVRAMRRENSLIDTLTFTISDGHGGTEETTVRLNVTGVNDLPQLGPPITLNQASFEDSTRTISAASLLLNISDPDGDTLTITSVNATSSSGAVVSLVDGNIIYDPTNAPIMQSGTFGEILTDTFTFTVSDGHGGSVDRTVSLDVIGLNDAPVVESNFALSGSSDENSIRIFTTTELLSHAFDLDGDMSVTIPVNPFGIIHRSASGAAISQRFDGTIIYDPTNAPIVQALGDGESLTDSFTYKIVDSSQSENLITVSLNVTGINDAPVFVPTFALSGSSDENHIRTLDATTLLANVSDPDGDAVTITSVNASSSRGAAVSLVNGDIVYDPTQAANVQVLNDGESLTDVLMYTISDGHGGDRLVTVSLNVTGVSENHAPVFVPTFALPGSSDENSIRTLDAATLLANVSDPDGDTVTITSVNASSSRGAAVSLVNGNIVYDPTNAANVQALNDGESLTDVLMYTISDGHGGDRLVTVSLNVTGVSENHAPVFAPNANPSAYVDEDYSRTVAAANLLASVSDPDGDTVTITSVNATSALGAAVSLVDGNIVYDPTAAATLQALKADPFGYDYAPDVVTYTVSDGHGGYTVGTFTMYVRGMNDAPVVASPVSLQIAEGSSPLQLDLLAGASDVDGDSLRVYYGNHRPSYTVDGVEVSSIPSGFTQYGLYALIVSPSSVAFDDLGIGETRVIGVNYRIYDGNGASVFQSIQISITGTNDAPVFVPTFALSGSSDENSIRTLDAATLLANVSDPDGDTVTISSVNATSSRGAAVSLVNGDIVYDPTHAANVQALNDGESLTDVLMYTISDGHGGDRLVTVSLNVTGVSENHAPVVVPTFALSGSSDEDHTRTISAATLLANVSDPDGDTVTITSVNATSSRGAAVSLVNGNIVYDPTNAANVLALNDGESLTDFVVYTISDGHGASSAITVSLNVTGVSENHAPVFVPTFALSGSSDENSIRTISAAELLANVSDPDGDTVTITSVNAISSSGATVSLVNGNIVYDPTPSSSLQALNNGQSTSDHLFYTISDGHGGTGFVTASLNVTGVNNAPEVTNDLSFVLPENGGPVTFNLLSDASDLDGDTLTVSGLTYAIDGGAASRTLPGGLSLSGAQLTVNTSSPAFDDLQVGETRVIRVAYTISDGHGGSVAQSATMTIEGRNDFPFVPTIALPDGGIYQNTKFPLFAANLLANASDPDGDTITIISVRATTPLGATVSLVDGNIIYDPTHAAPAQELDSTESLADIVTYTISDGHGGTYTGTVSLTVRGLNDAPTTSAVLSYVLDEDDRLGTFDLLAGATDIDNDPLTVSGVTYAIDNGAASSFIPTGVSLSGSRLTVRTSDDLAVGETRVIHVAYTISDIYGASVAQNATVTIEGRNDAPVFVPTFALSGSSDEDHTRTISAATLLANVSDPDGDTVTITSVNATSSRGAAVSLVNGDIVYDPTHAANVQVLNDGESLTDDLMYTISDGHGGDRLVTVSLNVTGVSENHAPVAVDDPDASAVTGTPALNEQTFILNASPLGTNDAPSVAVLSNGHYATVYVNYDSQATMGQEHRIYGRVMEPGGVPVSSEFVVNSNTSGDEFAPKITALKDGGFAVVWIDTYDADPVDSNQSIHIRLFDADGTARGDDVRLFNNVGQEESRLSVDTLADGRLVVSWSVSPDDWSGHNVLAAVLNPDGSIDHGPFQVNQNDVYEQTYSQVTALANGEFVVTWYDNTGEPYDEFGFYGAGVTARLYAADGSALGSEFLVNSTTFREQYLPDVTQLADGRLLFVWRDESGDYMQYGSPIRGRFFNADGSAAGEDIALVTRMTASSNIVEGGNVLALPNGQFVLTWLETQNYVDHTARAQVFDATGAPVGDEMVLGDSSGAADLSLDLLANGDVVVTWSGLIWNGTDFISAIKSRVIDIDAAVGLHVNQESSLTLDAAVLLANDFDADGDLLTLIAVSGQSAHGASVSFIDGHIVYDAAASSALQLLATGETLTDTFTYTISDGLGGTSTATVSLTVHGTNSAPVANDDIAFGPSAAGNVLFNDTDIDAPTPNDSMGGHAPDGLSIINAGTYHGTYGDLILNADGSFSYTRDDTNAAIRALASTDVVADTFAYTVSDPRSASDSAEITVYIHGLNEAPVATDDGAGSVQPVEATEEFRINTTTAGYQMWQASAALADGGFIVAWTALGADGYYNDIFAQRYAANGSAIGGEFLVNSNTLSHQSMPSLTGLPDGGFLIVWDSNGPDGNGNEIYAQRYAADGSLTGSEFRVNTSIAGEQSTSAVATLANGGFVVSWQSSSPDTDSTDVFAQVFAGDGVKVGTEFRVNSYTSSFQSVPSVTGLDGGGFVIAWMSENQDGSYRGVYGQRYHADGSVAGGEFLISTTTLGFQETPTITSLSGGGFVATWSSNDMSYGSGHVYGQLYAADGARIGSEFVLSNVSFLQDYAFVSRLADGGFVVAWRAWGQDGNNSGIFGQRFTDSGQKLGAEFQINSFTQGDQHYPTVTGLANGSFVATWMSEGQDGSSYGIYGKVYGTPLHLVASEDSALVLAPSSLLANDTDGNGDALSIAAVSATSSYGAAVSLVGGQIIYDPTHAANAQALGIGETLTDSFTYTIQDIYGAQATATVTVNVVGANDAPVVVPVILGGSKPEDALRRITSTELLAHVVDPDGDSLSISSVSATSASGATVTLDGTDIVYDPKTAAAIQAMHNGDQLTDYVFYSVSDGHGGSSTGTVSLVVTGRSDTPTVSGALALSVDEDAAPQSLDLLTGASDAEGDALAISSLTYAVDGGTASSTLPSGLSLSGTTLTIDPTSSAFDDLGSGDSRVIRVSYRVTDGSSSGAVQTAVLTVNAPNAAPTVSGPITFTTTEYNGAAGTSSYANINLLSGASDPDGDSLSVSGFSFAADGVASNTVPAGLMILGTMAYIDPSDPAFNALHDGEARTITVSYTISDGNGGSVAQSAQLTINGATDAPKALADSVSATQLIASDNVSLIDTSVSVMHTPSEIHLSSGGSVILSTTYELGANGADISGQLYSASGIAAGNAFKVNSYTLGAQNELSAAALSNGGFVVTWESYGQDGSGFGIYGQLYNNAGLALGGEFQINTTTANHQYHPDVTALTGGGFVVSWISLGQDGNESGFYGQRYDASGVALGGEFKINTTAAGFQMNAGFIATDDGGFYASWLTADQSNGGLGWYRQSYNAAGAAIGSEDYLRNYMSLTDPRFSNNLAIGNNQYIVAWTSFNAGANAYEFYGQRYNIVGEALSDKFLITSSAISPQTDFILSGGGAFGVVEDYYGPDGSYYGQFNQGYSFASTDEDTALSISAASLIANDTDSEGDALSVIGVSAASTQGAAVSLVDGQIIYDPTHAARLQDLVDTQITTDSFSYTVSDGHGGTTTTTASLLVVGQNDPFMGFFTTRNGTVGNDSLEAFGFMIVNGRDGDDRLIATGAQSTLDGGAGNDTLLAAGANDVLLGGSGNDNIQVISSTGSRMEGGSGADTLVSSAGSDTIVFGQDGGNDILFNFTSGTDVIEIAAALAGTSSTGTVAANGTLGGTILFEAVNGNVAASNASATLIYDTASSNLYIDADGGTSASGRSLLVHLESGASLTATDIHIS